MSTLEHLLVSMSTLEYLLVSMSTLEYLLVSMSTLEYLLIRHSYMGISLVRAYGALAYIFASHGYSAIKRNVLYFKMLSPVCPIC